MSFRQFFARLFRALRHLPDTLFLAALAFVLAVLPFAYVLHLDAVVRPMA